MTMPEPTRDYVSFYVTVPPDKRYDIHVPIVLLNDPEQSEEWWDTFRTNLDLAILGSEAENGAT